MTMSHYWPSQNGSTGVLKLARIKPTWLAPAQLTRKRRPLPGSTNPAHPARPNPAQLVGKRRPFHRSTNPAYPARPNPAPLVGKRRPFPRSTNPAHPARPNPAQLVGKKSLLARPSQASESSCSCCLSGLQSNKQILT